jgi:hypothetical protein
MARKSKAKRSSAKSAGKKIGLAELVNKIGAGKITEKEIGRCFFATQPAAGEFVPRLVINPAAVDVSGRESLAHEIGNDLGYKATEVARVARLVAGGAPAPNGTIVAEGDSWFNLPDIEFPIKVPPTLMDFLAQRHPINNIAHWGDTMTQMIAAGEYLSFLTTGNVKFLLFSAGGNEALGGGQLAKFLHQRHSGDKDPNNAPLYINPLFDKQIEDILFLYGLLVENVRQLSPNTILVVHGYDYCLPVPRGASLGSALESRGFLPTDHRDLCRAIIREMLDRYNKRLKQLADGSGGQVRYAKLLGTVKNSWWDEIHPDAAAAKKLAAKVETLLN